MTGLNATEKHPTYALHYGGVACENIEINDEAAKGELAFCSEFLPFPKGSGLRSLSFLLTLYHLSYWSGISRKLVHFENDPTGTFTDTVTLSVKSIYIVHYGDIYNTL